MPTDYYETLQVSPNAEQVVIEAAYRRLAWKYHPDVNKDPGAPERMKAINEAYEVLGDATRRAAYDDARTEHPSEQNVEREESRPRESVTTPPVVCEGCGRVDASLRASVFLYVISVVLLSFRRGGGAGILCSSCRTKRGWRYALTSFLLGPWGIPWGLIWTIQAVLTDLLGGRQPPEVNAPLLQVLGLYFVAAGKPGEAIDAFQASLGFQENQALREMLTRLQRETKTRHEGPRSQKGSCQSPNWKGLGWAAAALIICIGAAIFSRLGDRTLNVSSYNNGTNANVLPTATTFWPTWTAVPSDTAGASQPPSPTYTLIPQVLFNSTPISERTLYICVPVANVREGPGLIYPVATQLNSGAYFTVYAQAGEWFYAGYDEPHARYMFVHQSVVCDSAPAPQPTDAIARQTTKNTEPTVPPEAAPQATAQRELDCWEWIKNGDPRANSCIVPDYEPTPTYPPECVGYRLPYSMNFAYRRDNIPIRAITRPNGIKVYFDVADAEYYDPNEQGTSTYYYCPAQAEAAGYAAAHPK